MKGEFNRTIMIYIDSYNDGIPTGHFHIVANNETIPFVSLSQLLLGINDALNTENFPQSFSELRKFQTPQNQTSLPYSSVPKKKGEKATFSIRILFRQNASWQGIITWVEGAQEEYFRSVLELVMLLDNALLLTNNK